MDQSFSESGHIIHFASQNDNQISMSCILVGFIRAAIGSHSPEHMVPMFTDAAFSIDGGNDWQRIKIKKSFKLLVCFR